MTKILAFIFIAVVAVIIILLVIAVLRTPFGLQYLRVYAQLNNGVIKKYFGMVPYVEMTMENCMIQVFYYLSRYRGEAALTSQIEVRITPVNADIVKFRIWKRASNYSATAFGMRQLKLQGSWVDNYYLFVDKKVGVLEQENFLKQLELTVHEASRVAINQVETFWTGEQLFSICKASINEARDLNQFVDLAIKNVGILKSK